MLDRLAHYFYNKGLEYAKKGMISAAIEELLMSLSYNRDDTQAWKLAGLCFYRLGRLGLAEYCWAMCLQYGDNDYAAERYIETVRLIAGKIRPYTDEVFTMAVNKKYKKASAVFRKKVMPAFNSHAEAFSYLGILYMLSGHKRKAVKEWKKALQIDCSATSTALYVAFSDNISTGRSLLRQELR